MRTKIAAAVLIFSSSIFFSGAALATPKIQHWQVPSGARVYFVEDHDLPILDVAVDFAAGSGFDTAEKAGLAGLTYGLLDLGAEGMNEDEIARNLADIGAQMGGRFDADRAGMSLRTLSSTAERDQALSILARVVQRPLFPENVLAREKTRVIASLKEAETKPESIAVKAFGKAVFGAHPYGLSSEVSSVEKIQRADIEAFYRAHYFARAAVVSIMGDLTRAEA